MVNFKTGELEYKQGLVMSQIVLADEINRTSPKTQSSLLEVMEEGQVTVDGTTYRMPSPFIVLATQNPVDFVGTYPLPEAQLDRFMLKILVDFPTLKKRLQQKKLDFALQLELVPLEDTPSLLRAQVGQLRQYVVLNRQSHLSSYASLHRSQLASEQYYVPAMDRELWNQFAQVLTRHGSDPQNIKFAYSMEELMLQLAFYGGYTILAEPVLAQLPANKNLTFIPLENDTVPAWAVWNRENISPALRLLLRELDIDP